MKKIKTVEIKEIEYKGSKAYRLYVNGEYTPLVAEYTQPLLEALAYFSVAILDYINDSDNLSLLYHANCSSDYSGYREIYLRKFDLLSI